MFEDGVRMPDYVVPFPETLVEKVKNLDVRGGISIIAGKFQEAEKIFNGQYDLIRSYEDKLPKGKRHHKGAPLHNTGFAILLQNDPKRTAEGYQKIFLAFIEDLLDFPTIENVHNAPAYKALLSNPFVTTDLLKLIEAEVERRKAGHNVPRQPEDVLKPIEPKTQEVTKQPIRITIKQVKYAVDDWLEKKGKKDNRVFIGGNYKNIALLKHIAQIVRDLGFFDIMPIDLPETSDESYEELIHDISIEMLSKCSYAIFEVSISNGHLMEIERAKDFKGQLNVILVYQVHRDGESPFITRMLMSKNFEKKPYRNFSELTTTISTFLQSLQRQT